MAQMILDLEKLGGGAKGYLFKEVVHKLTSTNPSFTLSLTTNKNYIIVLIGGSNNNNYPNKFVNIVSTTGMDNLETVVSPTTYTGYTGAVAQYQFSAYSFKAVSDTVTIKLEQESNQYNKDCLIFEQAE